MSELRKLPLRVTQHILQIFPTLSPRFSEQFSGLVASVPINYARNVEIFGEQEPVQYLYKIMEGAVRTCRVLTDGRRQIAGFYLPGEFLVSKSETNTFYQLNPSQNQKS